MVVLQFAFDRRRRAPHRPDNHEEHSVAYTGTHDTDTARGLVGDRVARGRRRSRARRSRRPGWATTTRGGRSIRLVHRSPAGLAMIQVQDVLGLGSEARMNMPGTARGSWRWKLEDGALTDEHAARLRESTEAAGR